MGKEPEYAHQQAIELPVSMVGAYGLWCGARGNGARDGEGQPLKEAQARAFGARQVSVFIGAKIEHACLHNAGER